MADIVQELTVNASPARVFQAFATPEGLDRWWTKAAAGTPQQGAEYLLTFGPGCEWKGCVTRYAPDSTFELQVTHAHPDWIGTCVGCRLRPEGETATRVHFYHTGWPSENQHWRISNHCWALYLRIMRRYLEFGETVAYEHRLNV